MKRIIFVGLSLAFLAAGATAAQALTTLATGDIAFTRMNLDAPDSFSFVPLVDIDGGTVINFSSFGYAQGVFKVNSTEAQIRWTAPVDGVSAGTVIDIAESATANEFTTSSGSTSLVAGVSTDPTGDRWDLRTAGDSILAFTGAIASPTFIAGILMEDNWNAELWNPATEWALPDYAGSLNGSALPSALTNGTTAISVYPPSIPKVSNVSIEKDNSRYKATAISSGTRAQLLASINNYQNWESDDITAYPAPAIASFTIVPEGPVAPAVAVTPTSSAITVDSAVLGGSITSAGTDAITERGVVYATTALDADPNVGDANATAQVATGTAVGAFTVNVGGLAAGTSYSFKAYAKSDAGTAYSSVGTFTTETPDTTAPYVVSVKRQTPSGQSITNGSVTFRVTYSEAVNISTPMTSRYAVTPVNGSNVVGTVTGVTPVSSSIYDVAVNVSSGLGEFRLRVLD